MKIELLSAEQLIRYRSSIKELLEYCRKASSNEIFPDIFYEQKMKELEAYLQNKSAFLFVSVKDGAVTGFLWACEIIKDGKRRFHVLYFAVTPSEQGKGTGRLLMEAAEKQARELGIAEMELNVHCSNCAAMEFYMYHGYGPERILMKKEL